MTSTRIDVRNVSKVYPAGNREVAALDDVTLSIRAGEFVSILGPSGCGKSTLMMIIAGLMSRSAGTVSIDGRESNSPLTDVGIVFQSDMLLPFRTALDNVALQGEVRGKPKKEARADSAAVLTSMGLEKALDRYPSELSGGMRQRVSIARAFVHRPSTLLMDEPFGALDAITRIQMQQELERLWLEDGERKTVVFITHSVEEAVRLSDRVIVLRPSPGRVAEEIVIDAPRPRPIVVEDDAELTRHSRHIYQLFDRLGII